MDNGADLAAAVSNAGGLGTLGPNAGASTVTADVAEKEENRDLITIRNCPLLTRGHFIIKLLPINLEFRDHLNMPRFYMEGYR